MIPKLFNVYPPVHLLLAAVTYTLGAGIARYLGYSINFAVFGEGLLALLSLQGAAFFLAEYFRLPLAALADHESPRQREKFRLTLLQVSFATLTLSFVAILTLLFTRTINILSSALYVVTFLSMVAYAIPPIRLSANGYGELVLAIYLGTFVPAFAFLLQSGVFHHLLSFVTFPLTLLALAFLLVSNFPTFATDLKYARLSLLTRLTWQRAIPIHHLLILLAYLFFSSALLLNIPWGMIWPVFLTLPFAVVQVLWLQRIANGRQPVWNFLSALSIATFGLSAYFLGMTFWLR